MHFSTRLGFIPIDCRAVNFSKQPVISSRTLFPNRFHYWLKRLIHAFKRTRAFISIVYELTLVRLHPYLLGKEITFKLEK